MELTPLQKDSRGSKNFPNQMERKGKTEEGEKQRSTKLLTSTWKSLRPKGAELAETV